MEPTKLVTPSAPPLRSEKEPPILEREKKRPSAHEVHGKATPSKSTPTVKFSGIDEDDRGFTPGRGSLLIAIR